MRIFNRNGTAAFEHDPHIVAASPDLQRPDVGHYLGDEVTRLSAQAKLFASEVAVRAGERAVQIHGGYGYTKDYPVEKFWRDSKLCTIGEGTSEIQKLVIAAQLLPASEPAAP